MVQCVDILTPRCVLITLFFRKLSSHYSIKYSSVSIGPLEQFYPSLLRLLPMDDSIFFAKLRAAGLVPRKLMTKIKSLSTSTEKAEYFLDHLVTPNLQDNKTLSCLLGVMKASGGVLNALAIKIERSLKVTLATPETASSTSHDG